MRRKKFMICLIVALFVIAYGTGYFYWSFNIKNIDSGLSGADEISFSNERNISRLDYSLTEKKHLILSRAYWIEYEGGCQIRLRVGCQIPFLHENLISDTEWELTDSERRLSEEVPIMVYPESIMGVHCVNITIPLTAETAEALEGEVITFRGNCAESGEESGYGRFVLAITVPKMQISR